MVAFGSCRSANRAQNSRALLCQKIAPEAKFINKYLVFDRVMAQAAAVAQPGPVLGFNRQRSDF
jgi:hypothetical protein